MHWVHLPIDHEDLKSRPAADVAGVVALWAADTFIKSGLAVLRHTQQGQFFLAGLIGGFAVGADLAHQTLGDHAPEGAGDEPRLHADVPQTVDGGDGVVGM